MTVNNSISPQYWTNRFAKSERAENAEFISQAVTQQTTANTMQAQQASAIPQELARQIDNLSQTMIQNIGAYSIVWYASSQNATNQETLDYNVSYILGGYEYSISKSDKELQFSKEAAASGKLITMTSNATENYQGGYFPHSANDLQDKSRFSISSDDERENARFRPFVNSFATGGKNPYAYNGETATFPQELDKQDDFGYSYSDMKESFKKIENLLDKYLVSAYQNDPDSTETNQLLFLKAKLQSLPDTLQKGKEIALDEIRQNLSLLTSNNSDTILSAVNKDIESFERFTQYEVGMLAEFSMNLAALLPDEQKQELMDALNVILNYTDHRAFEFLNTNVDQLETALTLKNAIDAYGQSLVSQLGAVDNTQILFELTEDSSIRYNSNNIKESLEKKFNSKAGDSLLQQALAAKAQGVAKTTEVSA